MSTPKELREKRVKLIADSQVILKQENRTADDIAKANRMLDDADTIKTEYEAIERAAAAEAETRSARQIDNPQPGALENAETRAKAEKEAFRSYIVTGRVSEAAERTLRSFDERTMQTVPGEKRDMGIATGAGGGYLVPVGFQKELESAMLAYGKQLTVVRQWATDSGQPIQWPLSDDVANYSQEMTDGTDVTELDIPLGQKTFNVSTFSTGVIKVSRSLITDSAFDVESFIRDNFAVRQARGLNKAVTNGSTSGNVASIITGATLGATSAAPTAVTYLDLVGLYGALDPAYVGNATWAFNNAVLRQLIALEDNYGRPLFLPSITSGVPDTVLGRPYVLNQDLAAPAATSKSILFGDMSKYVLRSVAGLEVLRLNERYAPANQVGFVGFHRNSGVLLDAGTHPILYLQQHA
jgi:HK97 family phage major capsid protein